MQVQDARVQEICSHLQDDVSRFIFEKRLMFSLTSDYRWIQEIIERAECMQSLHAELHREERKRFLFGAGRLGRTMALLAPECWLGIADNDPEKQGKKLYGVDIVSPEMLRQHPDAEIYVAICGDQKDFISEIVSQIKDLGFSADQIHFLDGIHGAMVAGQYFDLSDLPHDRDEVFVDAGSYDGGTSQQFVQWAGGDYHHIYAFESNPESLPKCEKGLAQISKEKTTLIPYGVWKNRGELHFASLDHDMMQVDEQGGLCLHVTSIDEELEGKRVTFIKMDVEGAELAALQGAQHVIRKQHPKLAICVYHKPEDIIDIPSYILSLDPGYRLFLRHYSPFEDETVLYAI